MDNVSRSGNPEKEPKNPRTAGDQTVTETDCFGGFLSRLGMAEERLCELQGLSIDSLKTEKGNKD